MSIRALRTLQAIARTGSFARAGEVVGLTQSAVSLQVKTLEAEFGALLFDRSRRLPVLTDAGRIVLERSAEVLALYDQIAPALGDEQSLAGRLKLGAIQTALSGFLPDAIAALYRAHPKVRIQVAAGMSAELAQQVATGDLDAAITTEPVAPYPRGLVWQALVEDSFWIVAPPDAATDNLKELVARHPFIRFDRRAWAGRMIDRELRRQKIQVREEMTLDSQEVILRMVGNGLGIAVIPLSDRDRYSIGLTCVPFGIPQLRRGVVLLEREDLRSAKITVALARAISGSLG